MCSLINAVFYFLKPDESSDVFTIKEMFKQLPTKIPKALSKSPITFLLSPGSYPNFPPWLALPSSPFALLYFLSLPPAVLVNQHKHSEYSWLWLWEIVFPFLFYRPLNPSVAEVHIQPCYPRCCSLDTL